MARSSTTHVLEIESGIGEPGFIPLTLGQELQPISVGKKAMWRVESPRVLDVHAFVYFDGEVLFVQSAEAQSPALVDGQEIAAEWTEVEAPCRIEIGQAKIRFRSLMVEADAQRTQRVGSLPAGATLPTPAPLPAPSPSAARGLPVKPERPFAPGAFVSAAEDESTRFAPVEQTNAGRRPRFDDQGSRPVRPAAGMPPAGMGASGGYPMPMHGAGAPPAMGSSPPGMMHPGSGPPPGMVPGSAPPPGMHPGGHPSSMPPPGMYPGAPSSQGLLPNPSSDPRMMGQGTPTYGTPRDGYAIGPSHGGYPHGSPSAYPQGGFPQGVAPYGAGPMPNGSIPPPGVFPSTTLQPATVPSKSGFGATWQAMPPLRRFLILLSPFLLGATYYLLFVEDTPRPKTARPATSATGVAEAVPITAPSANVIGSPDTPPDRRPTSDASAPPPPVGSSPAVPPSASAAPASATSVPRPGASGSTAKAPVPALAPGEKTLERQAIDAYALGDYARAAEIYEQLSAAYPNNVVYKEAARIIRTKIQAGTQ